LFTEQEMMEGVIKEENPDNVTTDSSDEFDV
jgi:hypothetical protein